VNGPRCVVVSGAARGLGAAVAADLAGAGCVVGVLDRDRAGVASVVEALGRPAVALDADTTDGAAIDRAFERFAEVTGRRAPDAVVANAGIVRFGPLLELDGDDWRAVVEVNLTGTFLTARAAARRMVAAGGGGAIVTVTSMNGVAPGPNSGAYSAAKAGVARLTQQMALEWGAHGIRVNAVAPGLIDGGMSEPIYADAAVRARRGDAVPLGRLGTPADVAAVVRFLISDEAAYVTGTELLVDGGVTGSVIASLPRPAAVDGVGPGASDDAGADR